MTRKMIFMFFLLKALCSRVVAVYCEDEYYAIVIDGGSTGSRAFIYKFFVENGERKLLGIEGKKVSPGISSFASNKDHVSSYLAPVLIHATGLIPLAYHNTTKVFVKATAGMRLLSETDQNEIWEALVHGLSNDPAIPYMISKDYVGTIDGRYEAYYAILASNFIIGRLDTSLKPANELPLVGALDMGGSSTQMVFHIGSAPNSNVTVDDFWSHSWLSYGVDTTRQRVWAAVISNDSYHLPPESIAETAVESSIIGETIRVGNPCLPLGYEEQVEDSQFLLVGTSDAKQCQNILRQSLWPEGECSAGTVCPLNNIQQPSIKGLEFFAMSVYFYALDCIRKLGPNPLSHWPRPTTNELLQATEAFCGVPWSEMKTYKHSYTKHNQLPHRCLQGLFLVTLLEDVFGFNPKERAVTFALEVAGNEVQWTFGFALAELILPSCPETSMTTLTEEGYKPEVLVEVEVSVDGELQVPITHSEAANNVLKHQLQREYDQNTEERERKFPGVLKSIATDTADSNPPSSNSEVHNQTAINTKSIIDRWLQPVLCSITTFASMIFGTMIRKLNTSTSNRTKNK